MYGIDPKGTERGEYATLPKGFVEIAEPPTEDHILADNWQDDPMNADVCWRTKTTAELSSEKGERADLANMSGTLKAVLLAINDGTLVPGANATPAQLKTVIKAHL